MMDGFQIQEAWKQFKVYGDPHAREQLIRQYAHLVKLTVAELCPIPLTAWSGKICIATA
jgi:hypothetical protein